MITKTRFTVIDNEVQEAVKEVFDYIFQVQPDHNYVLLLANAEFKPDFVGNSSKLSPYVIDSRMDRYKDETRLKFFVEFMQTFYSFHGVNSIADKDQRIHMELMIYCHIWESKPYLRSLFRLASLAGGHDYPWFVEVPEMSKHDYLRAQVRDVLKTQGLKIADVISKGFHTSLRNAFAHSEYSFDDMNKKIHLDTFKGDIRWDIPNLTYDEWSDRFAYSALLSYYFVRDFHNRRKSLPTLFGKSDFLIIHPISDTRFRTRTIHYNVQHDSFSFYRP